MSESIASLISKIQCAQGPALEVSMEDVMFGLIGLLRTENYQGLKDLRQAIWNFEAKNPRRGTDSEIDALVDSNLYNVCDLADNFRAIPANSGPYRQRMAEAIRRADTAPFQTEGLMKMFYEVTIGYEPPQTKTQDAPYTKPQATALQAVLPPNSLN